MQRVAKTLGFLNWHLRRVALVGALLGGISLPRNGFADDATLSARPRTFKMLVDGSANEQEQPTIQAVSNQLKSLEVDLKVTEQSGSEATHDAFLDSARSIVSNGKALAVFWCEPSACETLWLYVALPSGLRVYSRSFVGTRSLSRPEIISLVVRDFAEVLLKGADPGPTLGLGDASRPAAARVEAPARKKTTPQAIATAKKSSRPSAAIEHSKTRVASNPNKPVIEKTTLLPKDRMGVWAAYVLNVYSRDDLAVHGAALCAWARPFDRISLWLGYEFFERLEAQSADVSNKMSRHPIAAGALVLWPMSLRLKLGVSAAALFDFVSSETTATPPAQAQSDGTDLEVAVLLQLRLEISLASWAGLFVTPGIEVPFNRQKLTIREENESFVLVAPLPVRPSFWVGVYFGLW